MSKTDLSDKRKMIKLMTRLGIVETPKTGDMMSPVSKLKDKYCLTEKFKEELLKNTQKFKEFVKNSPKEIEHIYSTMWDETQDGNIRLADIQLIVLHTMIMRWNKDISDEDVSKVAFLLYYWMTFDACPFDHWGDLRPEVV